MRSAIHDSHNPQPRPVASFGRIARRTAAPGWPGTHAPSANDGGICVLPPPVAEPDAQRLRAAARVHASSTLRGLTAVALRGVYARLLAWLATARKPARRRADYRALAELDARTLRDIGLSRGEVPSAAPSAARPVRARREPR